jgi:hypothetical protein
MIVVTCWQSNLLLDCVLFFGQFFHKIVSCLVDISGHVSSALIPGVLAPLRAAAAPTWF